MSGFRYPGEYVMQLALRELIIQKYAGSRTIGSIVEADVTAVRYLVPNHDFIMQNSLSSFSEIVQDTLEALRSSSDWAEAQTELTAEKKAHDETCY